MFKDSVVALLLVASFLAVATSQLALTACLLLLAGLAFGLSRNYPYPHRIQKTMDLAGVRLAQAASVSIILMLVFVAITPIGIHDGAAFMAQLFAGIAPAGLLLARRWQQTKKSPVLMEHNSLITIRVVGGVSASLGLLVVLDAFASIKYHVNPLLSPLLILMTGVLASLFIIPLAQEKSRHKLPKETAHTITERLVGPRALASYGAFGLIISALCYSNFLLFFARHHLDPRYLETTLPTYRQASSLAFATLILCLGIHVLFERSDRHDFFLTDHIWSNKRLLQAFAAVLGIVGLFVYVPFLQSIFKTQPIDIVDWSTAIWISIIYAGFRGAQRHTRKHSRHAVIKLHREVHG